MSCTTNQERWNYWMKDFGSPQCFIDWGFYSMISTLLQRRVWFGSNDKELFVNQYTVFVGKAGIGKGMVMGEIKSILHHPKLQKVSTLVTDMDEGDAEESQQNQSSAQIQKRANLMLKNMMIPMAPNATTFEAMCQLLGQVAQPMWYSNSDKPNVKIPSYHSSLYIHLSELGTLLRKHSEDIATLICDLYDCIDPFEYRTKHQGIDRVRKPCLNILAGCTPDFLRRVFSTALLNEGFASRTSFVVALANRFERYETPIFDVDQKREREILIDHCAKLSKLVGHVKFTKEALAYNKSWFEDPQRDSKRANPNPKLDPYYARKNITHAKLCGALHFADSLEMEIPLAIAEKATKILHAVELDMHHALGLEAKNPLAMVTDGILKFLKTHGKASKKQLLGIFFDQMPNPYEDFDMIKRHLIEQGKIKEAGAPNTYEFIKD